MKTELNKIAYLDGLRGAAAISVVFWHVITVFYPGAANGNNQISHLPLGFDIWLLGSSQWLLHLSLPLI